MCSQRFSLPKIKLNIPPLKIPKPITHSPLIPLSLKSDTCYNDFEYFEVLGTGATSHVTRVVHKITGQTYAMKTIRYEEKEQKIQNTLNDIYCLNILKHKNIVSSYTCFYHESQIHILISYVNGGSLFDYLQEIKRVPEDALGRIVWNVIQGLLYLKKSHFIHRDLKPSNILLSLEGEIKIADFGIARQLVYTTELVGTCLGTLLYMSPERLECHQYGFKCDIWSLGMIVYECAYGDHPLKHNGTAPRDYWQVIQCLSSGIHIDLGDDYSMELKQFLQKCLVLNQDKRASIEELANDIWVLKYSDIKYDQALLNWVSTAQAKRMKNTDK